MSRAVEPDRVTRPAARVAYAAAAWAVAHAALNIYWALGGTIGLATLGEELREAALARDSALLAATWGAAALKLAAAALAVALVRRRHRLLLASVAGAGIVLTLYGGSTLVQFALIEAGVVGDPEAVDAAAVRWRLALWQPLLLLGGVLFLATAWLARRPAEPEVDPGSVHRRLDRIARRG